MMAPARMPRCNWLLKKLFKEWGQMFILECVVNYIQINKLETEMW